MVNADDSMLFRSASAGRVAFRLTLALAGASAVSSLGGAFFERSLYWRDLPYWTTQMFAQDLANLVVLLPVLLVAAVAVRRGSARALPVWLGLILFLAYVYACYGFATRFNRLFLVDCAAFGLCVYLVVLAVRDVEASAAGSELVGDHRPALWTLALTGTAMTLFWLAVAIPAAIDDRLPEYAVMNGYVSSPIHMLDLGVFFPGLVAAAVLLRRRSPLASVFGPALLVFSLVMTANLVLQAVALAVRGFEGGLEFTPVFALVGLASFASLLIWMSPTATSAASDPARTPAR